jgi:hypothetical protein
MSNSLAYARTKSSDEVDSVRQKTVPGGTYSKREVLVCALVLQVL